MSAARAIRCDSCNSTYSNLWAIDLRQLRAELKKAGWKVALPKGLDICPGCIKRFEQEYL